MLLYINSIKFPIITQIMNMKVLFLLLFSVLLPQMSVYTYDYRLTYEWQYFETDSTFTTYLYGNKINANYKVEISTNSKSDTVFHFAHHNKLNAFLKFSGDIKNPGSVKIKRDITTSNPISFPDKSQHYNVEKLTDTIIHSKSFARIKIVLKNKKRAERKNIGTGVYHFDTSYNIKPVFNQILATNLATNNNNFPNGIVTEFHYYNYNGKLFSSQILKNMSPLNFNISITD